MPCRRNSPRRCDPILLTKEKYINIVIIDPPYGSAGLLLVGMSINIVIIDPPYGSAGLLLVGMSINMVLLDILAS